jgi:hypothetical protein
VEGRSRAAVPRVAVLENRGCVGRWARKLGLGLAGESGKQGDLKWLGCGYAEKQVAYPATGHLP